MVVIGQTPGVAHGAKPIGAAVAVLVDQFGQLRSLHDEHLIGLRVDVDAEGFVQAVGKQLPFVVGERPDLAFARADKQLAVAGKAEPADAERDAFWQGDCLDPVARRHDRRLLGGEARAGGE